MNTTVSFEKHLIAPCGMNCGTCLAYLREKHRCSGCGSSDDHKANHCSACSIKNCDLLEKTASKLCYDCEKFPCLRMKQLDKRYRTRYNSNLIENLETIKKVGITEYLLRESVKWTCSRCGSVLCVHRDKCLVCGEN